MIPCITCTGHWKLKKITQKETSKHSRCLPQILFPAVNMTFLWEGDTSPCLPHYHLMNKHILSIIKPHSTPPFRR